MLWNVGYFNNFGAHSFNLKKSAKYEQYNRLLIYDKLVKTSIIDYKSFKQFCIFGSDILDITDKEIININFPNKKTNSNVLEIFLDSWAFTSEVLYNKFEESNSLFFITSNFFSHLEDPRPLLLSLKKIGLKHKLNLIYVENGYSGYRIWSEESIKQFFIDSGFEVLLIDNDTYHISLNEKYYSSYIKRLGFNSQLVNSHLLYISNEDATLKPTGGIGTYIKNIKQINPNVVVLVCDMGIELSKSGHNTFVIKSLIEYIDYDNLMNGVGLIEAVKSILFLLPNINLIEFQDYQALGFRIVQAVKTGILPQNLWLRVIMHGGTDHIKYTEQNQYTLNYNFEDISTSVKEFYIASNVEQCFSPSYYLCKEIMQEEFGYHLNNLEVRKLPFDLKLIKEIQTTNIKDISQIVYIGKYNDLKGWPDFIKLINILLDNNLLLNIKNIKSLAPGKPSNDECLFLNSISKFEAIYLTHNELIDFIKQEKNNTIFVIPSKGENYPFVILELLLLGALFVSYNTGGGIEVVDDINYIERYFSDPNPFSLSSKIIKILSSDFIKLSFEIQNFSEKVYHRQVDINQQWINETHKTYQRKNKLLDSKNVLNEISLVVPIYNTPLNYIDDLVNSIFSSIVMPIEIIFIDNESNSEYILEFKNRLNVLCKDLNYRIVVKRKQDLIGILNSKLIEIKTPYYFYLDNKDILLPGTIHNAWISMQLDKELICATGFGMNFSTLEEIDNSLDSIVNGDFWKPIGLPEAKALSLYQNQFLPSSFMVNGRALNKIEEGDKYNQLFRENEIICTKLAWQNKKFSIIPWISYFHRNISKILPNNYNEYFFYRSIIKNISILSKLDANIIVSLMRKQELEILNLKEENIQKELEILNLKEENIQKELEISNLKEENIQKELEISNLKEENIQKELEILNVSTQLYLMEKSKSWKITKPLRVVSKLIRGQK